MIETNKGAAILDYQGMGKEPRDWNNRIGVLSIHKMSALSGKYTTEVANKLYYDEIEKIRKVSNEFGLKKAQKEKDLLLDFYPDWEPEHFKQFLIQLGEWEDYRY
ncbi:MAG: hypothetical protein HOA57_03025 [Candidatus Magasanikbacteria bacterium]|jgi:hypothetical protein|nr:hypothetical protein [Candidatus Magasanikbacteria bacterium]MBT4315110.1 hypothetical protein [Candidatus Magasanikbacteria bacterium]MBT4547434.1 hypothetical protein [Candidatus Magasanikbacteria bacterium]MBT6819325.1 hypothetical protein [Candidatus Magasanikbacteria bacterium]